MQTKIFTTQAMKNSKSKKQQFLDNFFMCFFIAITCSVLFFSPFWFPSLKMFLFVSLPKIGLVLLSPKLLFIIGNLIIVVLIGESKFFANTNSSSPTAASNNNVHYNEYINLTQSRLRSSSSILDEENVKETKMEKYLDDQKTDEEKVVLEKEKEDLDGEGEEEDDDGDLSFPVDQELSKRADDFIARVNKQRRLEARLLLCCNE